MSDYTIVLPDDVLIYRDGTPHVISRRKEDDTGWWLTDGGGISDRALRSGDFVVVDKAALIPLFNARTADPTPQTDGDR